MIPIFIRICFNKKLLQEIVAASDKLFQNLKAKGKISGKQLKDFTYQYKKVTNLGKLYLLPKIHERLANVPWRPVISNCGTPTEKASGFLDHHPNLVMQRSKSYIKDSGDFMNKLKKIAEYPRWCNFGNTRCSGLIYQLSPMRKDRNSWKML